MVGNKERIIKTFDGPNNKTINQIKRELIIDSSNEYNHPCVMNKYQSKTGITTTHLSNSIPSEATKIH